MSEELFSVPESKSPKLRWLEKHGVKTDRTPGEVEPDQEDEFGNEVFQWYAHQPNRDTICGGATEDEALEKLAKAKGWRLWFEEGYEHS